MNQVVFNFKINVKTLFSEHGDGNDLGWGSCGLRERFMAWMERRGNVILFLAQRRRTTFKAGKEFEFWLCLIVSEPWLPHSTMKAKFYLPRRIVVRIKWDVEFERALGALNTVEDHTTLRTNTKVKSGPTAGVGLGSKAFPAEDQRPAHRPTCASAFLLLETVSSSPAPESSGRKPQAQSLP